MDFKDREILRLTELVKSLQKGIRTLEKKSIKNPTAPLSITATEIAALEAGKKLQDKEDVERQRILDIDLREVFDPVYGKVVLQYRKKYKKGSYWLDGKLNWTYWTDWKTISNA